MAMDKDLMRSLAMEFTGTFFLVFVIAAGGNLLAIGAALMVMVYAGGHISGAAYNPAVALAQFLNGALGDGKKGDVKKLLFYWLAELLGGLLGAILGYMPRVEGAGIACPALHQYFHEGQMFLNEFLWVTALCYVVLTTACTEETKDKHFFGFCIGFTVGVAVLFGNLGGSYNPAVGVGLLIAAALHNPDNSTCSDDNFEYIWVYIVAPLLGGAAGWGLHRLTNGKHYGDGKFDKIAAFLQEFIGTFYLCLTISMTSIGGGGFGGFCVGTILAIMVYCGGHVSGGQYNPAVSLGVFIRGSQSLGKMFAFWGMQLLGAFAGAFVGYLQTRYASSKGSDYLDNGGTALVPVAPHIEGGDTSGKTDVWGVLLGEMVITFGLVFVVLATATTEKIAGNSFFGIAIGWTVMAGAYSIGTYTGGAFNPAAWTGLNLMYAFHESGDPLVDFWAYWVAHLGGGALAGLFYRFVGDVQGKIGAVSPA